MQKKPNYDDDPCAKVFWGLVDEYQAEGLSRREAIHKVAEKHPAAHTKFIETRKGTR